VSVPTWNYVAVHAYGTPRLVDDATEKHAVVGRLVAQHDADYAARFPDMPADYIRKMLGAIVAFEVRVSRIEARYKLSQEKHAVEVSRIVAELDAAPDSAARETADLMRRHGRK
jgi:transcriptional regulator